MIEKFCIRLTLFYGLVSIAVPLLILFLICMYSYIHPPIHSYSHLHVFFQKKLYFFLANFNNVYLTNNYYLVNWETIKLPEKIEAQQGNPFILTIFLNNIFVYIMILKFTFA